MKIKIRPFGKFAEFITDKEFVLENKFDTNTLMLAIKQKYPQLKEAKYFLVVDNKMITANTELNQHSVVDIMPPFSGG